MVGPTTVKEIGEAAYRGVVERSPESTVYHSPEFLLVLKDVLKGVKVVTLGLHEGKKLVGAIPCAVKETKYGSVVNSLPFHGSIGGCVFAAGEAATEMEERRALLAGVSDLALDTGSVSTTVITSPFSDDGPYRTVMKPDYTVDRVAQVLPLPDDPEKLMPIFNKKCRNSVRHAIAEGLKVEWDASKSSLGEVEEGQRHIMNALKAAPSPPEYFMAIAAHFKPGDGFRVYRAKRNGETRGLLLVLYHAGRSVEYLVPVVHPESRKYAPMNLIVSEAASDAIRMGFKVFSFGGTRPGQSELHRFKESFGAVDRRYHYFTRTHGGLPRVLELGEEGVMSQFKWFFVAPFSAFPKPSG